MIEGSSEACTSPLVQLNREVFSRAHVISLVRRSFTPMSSTSIGKTLFDNEEEEKADRSRANDSDLLQVLDKAKEKEGLKGKKSEVC